MECSNYQEYTRKILFLYSQKKPHQGFIRHHLEVCIFHIRHIEQIAFVLQAELPDGFCIVHYQFLQVIVYHISRQNARFNRHFRLVFSFCRQP